MRELKYPKIETLFNRNKDTFKVIEGEFRCPEFKQIREWEVSEKIHGMNIRVIYEPVTEITGLIGISTMHEVVGRAVRFAGRTNKAQVPKHLLEHLQETFTMEVMKRGFPDIDDLSMKKIILYGEGYGYKINNGGHYLSGDNVNFRVFDIFIEDHENPLGGWWLESEDMIEICNRLGVETVPILGICKIPLIIGLVKQGCPHSSWIQYEENDDRTIPMFSEGLVARSKPLMFTREGKRVMFKLKVKDFNLSE